MVRHYLPDPSPDLPGALARMLEALQLLDEAGAPGDIGAHLDRAIATLERKQASEPLTGDVDGCPWDIAPARSRPGLTNLIDY